MSFRGRFKVFTSGVAVALAIGGMSVASRASAQESTPPTVPPASGAAPSSGADAGTPVATTPPVKAEPAHGTTPGESPAVPTPSPVVIAGKPTPEDRVALPLGWGWSRFSTSDYVITGAAGAITLAAAILHPLKSHSLQGSNGFDDAVQKAVRSNDIGTRYAFRDASDVGLSLAATYPFFVDALATTWWYRGSRDAAEEMALLDLETLAIAGAAQGVTNVLVSRERPYGQYCGANPSTTSQALPAQALDCDGIQQYRSFFSGHATFSFTSAALICINHTKNQLLGSPWDGLSCAGGYVVAASTASLRVLADVHYASDILVGALVGTLIGYGVPLLHYRHHDIGKVSAGGMTLQLVPSVGGAGLVGTF